MASDSHPADAPYIPLSVPHLGGNEWDYVKDCLDTNWVSSVGAYVDRFEATFAEFIGTPFAVSAVNGTAALHLALNVIGIEPGDEVLVSDLTFIAPANAVRYLGAFPVLVDAEPNTWQMDVGKLAEFLHDACERRDGALINRLTGRPVKAILPVHILGHPVDMVPLMKLARDFGLIVVEDASESLGATLGGQAVGTLGDIACFSFNGNKVMTTGGGGMVVTENAEWAARAKHLSTQAKTDSIEFDHDAIGYNYRLTNVLAAIGCAQMEQLASFLEKKIRIARTYDAALEGIPGIRPMAEAADAGSARWMYAVHVDEGMFTMDSRALLAQLSARKIEARPLWRPMHMCAPHCEMQVLGGDVAQHLFENCLCLPCSVGLNADEHQRVIQALVEIRAAA